jgi:predicted nuclease of restriction endonuclease-like (RecB) superfamily
MATEPTTQPEDYLELVSELEARVRRTRSKAALAVNRKLLLLYWSIGRDILMRQGTEGWGDEAIGRLAADLRRSFPAMTGLSARNLEYMRAFTEAWPDLGFVHQVLVLLPWGHQTCLLDKLQTREQREWYAHQAIRHDWSRQVLSQQIESDLLGRQGGDAPARAVPAPRLAERTIDDPWCLDMLTPATSSGVP